MLDAPARPAHRRPHPVRWAARAGLAVLVATSLAACGGRDGGGGGGPVPTVPAETTAVTAPPG